VAMKNLEGMCAAFHASAQWAIGDAPIPPTTARLTNPLHLGKCARPPRYRKYRFHRLRLQWTRRVL
jgi:hypothetical protein